MPPSRLQVRRVRPAEYAAAGQVVATAYLAEGFGDGPRYADLLRDVARRDAEAQVLVAVDADVGVLGSVTYACHGSAWAEIAGPAEAEIRMLGVDPSVRGRGVGEALVGACIAHARAAGLRRLVLCTQPHMQAAQRLYARLGFYRAPERDWSPVPGLQLMAYELALHQAPEKT